MKKTTHCPTTLRQNLDSASVQQDFNFNPSVRNSLEDTQKMNVSKLLRSVCTISSLHTIVAILGIVALNAEHPAIAQTLTQTVAQAQPSPPPQTTSSTQSTQRVRWTPNRRLGSARSTLSGGRRGQATASCDYSTSTPSTTLALLVPNPGDGLFTTAANPSFFWHIDTSQPISARFILSDPKTAEPIFTKDLRIEETGISRIDLPDNVPLQVGTRYRWTVLLACKPSTFGEVAARSFIERIAQPTPQNALKTESPLDRAVRYASKGIWYDTLSTLITASQADPANPTLKAELRSLLTQAGQRQLDIARWVNTPSGS